MNSDKKILVLDIDGTLVNSKKKIMPKTREALITIQDAGHIVALASGRPYPGMVPFVKELRLEEYGGYVLSFNGGRVTDCKSGETVFQKFISNRYVGRVYEFALSKGLGLVTYEDDKVIAATEIDRYMQYEADLNHMRIERVYDFLSYVDFDIPKCLLTADEACAPGYEAELKSLLAPHLNVFRSEPYFIEVTRRDVDKAESVKSLLDILGMKCGQCICCGDGFNDLSMVKYAGIGVAMGNAQQIVKDAADYVTGTCDEDGLVDVIEKFIL